MKDLYVIFGILLLLLILISAFGGSIRYSEPFAADEETFADKDEEAFEEDEHHEAFADKDEEGFEGDDKDHLEGFDGGAYAGVEEAA